MGPPNPRTIRRWLLGVMLAGAATSASAEVFIENATTRVEAIGERGAYIGVSLQSGSSEVARVELSSDGRWTAASAKKSGGETSLTLTGIDTSGTGGTPSLGGASYVRFSLAKEDPYPRVSFRLDVEEFDKQAWESAWDEPCPMYFLRCSISEPELYYFHGLLAPTPRVDPYPFSRHDMRAKWADGWSTAPAIGALSVPAVGLWKPSAGLAAAYSFQHARSTDKSSRSISAAYSWGSEERSDDFFALLWPYQQGFNQLTHPVAPTTVESHFDLLHSQDLGPTDDLNELVLDHTWSRYRALLAAAPRMNDLGWMVERQRVDPQPPDVDLVRAMGEMGEVLGGSFRGVQLAYRRGDADELAALRGEVDRVLGRADWVTIDGDLCCRLPHPSDEGEAATYHNARQFDFAGALLAVYLNEPDDRLWRHVEGLYNWARLGVYTRAAIPDGQRPMSARQTSAIAQNFLMNLHASLAESADDEERRIAEEAFGLAQTIVWRAASITTGDPDPSDTLDPTFLMAGNHARSQLGQVGWSELSDVLRAMIIMRVETGDHRFEYFVRGALERWHRAFEADGYHTSLAMDVFGETADRGARAGVNGPADSFWEWAYPVGDAVMRVTAGREAAMAFCKGTDALEVVDYRFRPPANFSFRIRGPRAQPFELVISSPYRDLTGLPVTVNGSPAKEPRVVGEFGEHIRLTVSSGATVQVGDIGDVGLPRKLRGPAPGSRLKRSELREFDLTRLCTERIDRSWDDPDSWAGLSSGRHHAYGIPYEIVSPDASRGKVAVRHRTIRINWRASGIYLIASPLERGEVVVLLSNGRRIRVNPDEYLPVADGAPLRRWQLRMYPIPIDNPKVLIDEVMVWGNALVFSVTLEALGGKTVDRLIEKLHGDEQERLDRLEELGATDRVLARCRERVRDQFDAKRALRVAFLPPHDSRASDIRAACDALDIPSIGLRPEELVESGVLTPAHFPIVVHTGSERYIRTVQEPGDAERALTRYLKAGGTMLVLGARRPFSFADDLPSLDPKALNATLFGRTFGLDCLAPGDARGGAEAFDDRPDGDLAFRLEAGQSVFSRLPERMPFPSGDDHPFRPAVGELLSVDDEFRPLITLYDADGHRFGPAAALITRNSGGYAGTNVLWVWGPLVTDAFAHAESLIYQSLAAAAEMCGAASMVPPVPTEAQSAGATIAVLPLADVDRAGMIQDIGREMNADIGTVTEDVLADRTAFTADRYPIAIHAPKTEHYVKSWRLPNDGADAYKRYLDEGGFLIACGNGTQFSVASEYSDGQLRDVRSVRPEMGLAMGLPLMPGFEQPRGEMFLRQAPGQTVFANLIEPIHVTKITDKRWRGLAPTRGVGTEFIPLAHLTDKAGDRFNGYAAALIRRPSRDGRRRGAILYIWGNLIEGELGEELLRSAVRFALDDVQETPK